MEWSVLITANVFQNGLSQHEQSWRYYTEQLRRLSFEKINWYMSALDFDIAFLLPVIYEYEGDVAYSKACQQIRDVVRICPVNQEIRDESGFYRVNFSDTIRLACAVCSCVDAIVTWEPMQFASTYEERMSVQEQGYFYFKLNTENADDCVSVNHQLGVHQLGVFSVQAFLLHLSGLGILEPSTKEESCRFRLEKLEVTSNGGASAKVTIRNLKNDAIQECAIGSTPCEALFRAIDRCIDQFTLIPQRQLIHFSVPDTLGGADAQAEVRLGIECDRRFFESSATHSNMFWAFAEAYLQAINYVCSSLII